MGRVKVEYCFVVKLLPPELSPEMVEAAVANGPIFVNTPYPDDEISKQQSQP